VVNITKYQKNINLKNKSIKNFEMVKKNHKECFGFVLFLFFIFIFIFFAELLIFLFQ